MHRSFVEHAALATPGGVLPAPLPALSACGTPATARADLKIIGTRTGDYSFTPADIRLAASQSAESRLSITDGMTLCDFRLNADGKAREIADVDVSAGDSVEAMPGPVQEEEYKVRCDNKLPFMNVIGERAWKAA